MSDGQVFHARHFITVWEALIGMTKEWAHAQEWVLIKP
jgi:hypothetical protein